MVTYDGNRFTWDGNVGSVEASDLDMRCAVPEFQIKSHRTGRVLTFTHHHVELDRENEVIAHVYASDRFTVRVFND